MQYPESTLANFVLTHDEILRYVKTAGENDFVDAKGPCSWDEDATKASLAKDIAAFSNSEGGGAIVIGRAETTKGHFDFSGLTSEQCKSFDTTKVATWVNNHFSPPIRLTCCPAELDGRSFVVIAVAEFSDRPIICTKDRQLNGKALITKGTLYVRNENAESAPLMTPDQVSRLIGRATVKQQESLRQLFDSVLAGRTAKSIPTDEEQFSGQSTQVEQDLLGDDQDRGAWSLIVHPDTFEPRWNQEQLSNVIQQPRDWGISGGGNAVWGITNEGLLYIRRSYWENQEDWKSPYVNYSGEEKQTVGRGKWIDVAWTAHMLGNFFAFSSRFASQFNPGSQVRLHIRASNLKGRHLLSRSPGTTSLMDMSYDACVVNTFRYPLTLPAGQLVSSWTESCASCLYEFVTRFPGGQDQISRKSMEHWIESYTKEFGL
jgi:hypothetical protein